MADSVQPAAPAAERNARRLLYGTVVSTKMAKTITVEVERTFRHSKYGKFVREQRRVHAHDERGEAGVGDRVELMASRPLSKTKRWRLVRVTEAAPDRGAAISEAFGNVETVSRENVAAKEAAADAAAEATGEGGDE